MIARTAAPGRAPLLLAAAALLSACGGGSSTPGAGDGKTIGGLAEVPTGPGPAWFEEVGEESGVDFEHTPGPQQFYFPEIVGSGLALFDMDLDGDLDLYAVQSGTFGQTDGPTNRLYRNDGKGSFEDVTEAAGVGDGSYGMGAVVGDYDGDGDPDLYVTNVGANVLYRNDGDGTFTDVTAAAGVGHEGWGMSGVFFHADDDGDLDLFVTNYVRWNPGAELDCRGRYGNRDYCEPINYNAPGPDVLFLNYGDVTFEDATARLGLNSAFGNGMGVSCGDLDGDGRADLYVANDGTPNQLWLQTDEGFEESALLAGCAVNAEGHAEASMGAAAVDVDEDGDLDLFLTHLRGESNTLYLNQGGSFADRTARSGMSRSSLQYTGFGTAFADFDLDGMLDAYVVNGRVGEWRPAFSKELPYAEPDQLFRGLGDGRLEEVFPAAGTREPYLGNSRGLGIGDIDEDGDVDLVILDNGSRLRILRNVAERAGSWVLLDVRDAAGAAAIGAVVELQAAGSTRVRRVEPAFSYLTSNDPRIHVGLGAAEVVDEVTVRWPDGSRESFGSLPAGQKHVLRQGSGG